MRCLWYGLVPCCNRIAGLLSGRGFIYAGKQLSFVCDIADLYKAETTTSAAFEADSITTYHQSGNLYAL